MGRILRSGCIVVRLCGRVVPLHTNQAQMLGLLRSPHALACKQWAAQPPRSCTPGVVLKAGQQLPQQRARLALQAPEAGLQHHQQRRAPGRLGSTAACRHTWGVHCEGRESEHS